jgi:DNA-binding CsgD family transcriptional regulator
LCPEESLDRTTLNWGRLKADHSIWNLGVGASSEPANWFPLFCSMLSMTSARTTTEMESEDIALSPRERDCLRLLAQGKKIKELGEDLGIAVKTIDNYIRSAKKKTGARSRDQMIAIAVTRGLL